MPLRRRAEDVRVTQDYRFERLVIQAHLNENAIAGRLVTPCDDRFYRWKSPSSCARFEAISFHKSVRGRKHDDEHPRCGALLRAGRNRAELRRRLSVFGGLFVRCRDSEKQRLAERPRREIDADRQPRGHRAHEARARVIV